MKAFDVDPSARVRASASTLVEAPIERVWAALSDLQRWPVWNSHVQWVEMGVPLAIGSRFKWKADGWVIRSTVEALEAPVRIGWSGRALGVRARHVWRLRPLGETTEVSTEESFEGLFARLFPSSTRKAILDALNQGLHALKHHCEQHPEVD